jgi:putative transposase
MPRVDDGRVVSRIIYVIRNGMMWKDAPRGYGPHKTLYNCFTRRSRMGVFERTFAALAADAGIPELLIVDSTHLKAHGIAASLVQKGADHAASAAPRAG